MFSTIGLYAALAFAVGQRTREIAIRVALGAPRSGVVRMVLAQSLSLVGAGVAIGVANPSC